MKIAKVTGILTIGSLFSAKALAATPPPTAIPEIDGSGAIVAIALIAGLVALVREKFFRK